MKQSPNTDGRDLEERLAEWIHRVREDSACEYVVLYFLTEPGGRTFHLIPSSLTNRDHPPLPTHFELRESEAAQFEERETLTEPQLHFPSLESVDWKPYPLRAAGLTIGAAIAVGGADDAAFRKAVQANPTGLVRLWVEYLTSVRARTMEGILRITNATASTLSLRQVLLRLVQEATVLFGVKLCSLMLIDEDRQELVLQAAYGCSLEYLERPNLSLYDSLFGDVAQRGGPLIVDDVRTHPGYRYRELAKSEGLCSLLAVPIRHGEERLGILGLYSAVPRRWLRQETALVESLASSAAVAIRNARLAERVRETEVRLRESSRLATLGELSAMLAHQIRNPLAVLNVLIHSWKQSAPTPQQVHEDMHVIAGKIEELNTVVEGALHLARRRPIERQPVELVSLIEEALAFLDYRIQEQQIAVSFEKTRTPKTIAADHNRLQHALLNIVTNALEAAGEGGMVNIATWFEDDRAFVEIHDNGPGIDNDILTRVGEAFLTTKPNGLGLGVSVARRIAQDHGGELTAENHPDGGAVFRIILPRVAKGSGE